MSNKTKRISLTLIILVSSMIGLFVYFLGMVYFKMNPPLKLNKDNSTFTEVDSSSIIREKDSIINVLKLDNTRLKKAYDEKHDTVWVPKLVYLKPKNDTLK